MGRKRWKEEEIVEILRSAEKGDMSIGEVCRSFGISEVTFYKWRKRYGGVKKSEIRKLKDLENGFIESFNGKFRAECLNREMFWSRGETQSVCDWWRQIYNYFRPHTSLENKTPVEFALGIDFKNISQPPELEERITMLN